MLPLAFLFGGMKAFYTGRGHAVAVYSIERDSMGEMNVDEDIIRRISIEEGWSQRKKEGRKGSTNHHPPLFAFFNLPSPTRSILSTTIYNYFFIFSFIEMLRLALPSSL